MSRRPLCKRHSWTMFDGKTCSRCYATRVRRVKDIWGDYYHETELAQVTVSEGGWYDPKDTKGEKGWLTPQDIRDAEERWYQVAQATIIEEDETAYGPLQCGGCKFFAAAGADWGLCWNKDGPHDGRAVFEHNGCRKHSFAEYAFADSERRRRK